MKTWGMTLLVLILFAIVGGCSSTSPESTMALVPGAEAPDSGFRAASSLNWGAPIVLESSPPHCTIGRSKKTIGGNPAISYMIWSDEGPEPGFTVYYARANDSEGTSWADPVPVTFWPFSHDYNSFTSLCEVNGKPAIAYMCFPNGLYYCDVRFVRAKDAVGITWGSPVIVDPYDDDMFDFQGTGTTLSMVNGNPAIRYTDGGESKYVRASNPNGSKWGSPQIIGPGTFSIVNGYPTKRYSSGGVLYMRRAADPNGDSWLDPVPVGSGSSSGSLHYVNGLPALTYYDGDYLNYCRATDANGDSWGTPVVIGYINGFDYSFAFIHGNPAVAFTDGSFIVYYCRAEDSNGDSWGEVQNVVEGVIAPQKRLIEVDGNPAIVFSGKSIHSLSSIGYIRALDPDGINWPSTAIDITTSGDTSVEWLGTIATINGMPSIFFYSGIDVADHSDPENPVPPEYENTYYNLVQAYDSTGSTWEAPEAVYESGSGTSNGSPILTISETGAGIAFGTNLHVLNYVASYPAPPDPAVDVQLSTDKSNYVSGDDLEAVLTAVVTDEYGNPISGLGAGAFVTTLDGSGAAVDLSESATLGTYTGSLDISALLVGDHTVLVTVTDTRDVSDSDSAAFTVSEPGSGGTMHVGDLDGFFEAGKAGKWRAVFTVKIDDSSEGPVSGASVSYSLSGRINGGGTLTTGADGTASCATGWLRGGATFTFTVDDVTHATKIYDSADNHDPDGDFPVGGNSITISGP